MSSPVANVSAKMDGSVRIVALKGNEPVGAWEFDKELVTIGRSKTADVRLDDPAISRVHCMVEVRPQGVFVIDNGSRNGIWVNGHRVKEALLSSRDEVVIERFRIKSYMVWGQNATAGKFTDVVEERTNVNGAKRATPPAPIVPSSQQKTEIPRGRAVPVAPAKAVAKPIAPPALESTNAMPAEARPRVAGKGVTAEFEEALEGVKRPAANKLAAKPAIEESLEIDMPKPSPRAPAPRMPAPAPRAPAAKPAYKPLAKKAQPQLVWFEDEDEDEEETCEPAFDFVSVLAKSKVRPVEGAGVVEVIRYRGVDVLDVSRVDRGGIYEVPFSGMPLVHFGSRDAATIEIADGMSGSLRRGSRSEDVFGTVELGYGEVLDVKGDDGIGYLVRFAEAREPRKVAPIGPALAVAVPTVALSGAGSVTTHIVSGLLVMLIAMLRPEEPEFTEFATIEMPEEPEELAKVEPTPAPTPEMKAEPTPPPQKQPKTPPQKLAKRPVPKNNQPVGGADKTEAKVASAGVLGGLGKLDIKIDSKSPMLAAVTNLDTVRSTSGKSGGFRVSALTGKTAGDGVSLGRVGRANGNVEISTLSTKDLLAGGPKGGYGGLAKKGGGKVKGVVTQTPTSNVGVQGSLDRAQIAAVVNKHIQEIRHCYEKNLINDPSLSGKIQVEWTINPDGTVAGVKTKFSSMKGGDVTGCIAGRIRTWQFPRPKGNGYVIVNYPFMFDSVGF